MAGMDWGGTMILEEKLANWLELQHERDDLYWIPYDTGTSLQKFEPKTDSHHFKLVLERLTEDNWDAIEEKFEVCGVRGYLWISSHMPEVITAILEVLND